MATAKRYLWEYGITEDGNYIGSVSTDKLGFFGATPTTRQASTTDLKDALVNLGFIADSGATNLNLDSGDLTCLNLNVANDTTITDAGNVILATSTGTQIGTASTQKIGFLGATPVTRQGSTTDLKDLLVTFGLLVDSGATPLNLDGGALTAADISMTNDMTISDGGNIICATSTGTQIGTASTQKIGLLGATPVARQGNTTDLKDLLVTFGFLTDSGATPLNLDGGTLTAADIALTNDMTVTDAGNIICATSTGTQIATASNQKLGFFGTTPVTQQSLSVTTVATTVAVSTTSAIWGFSTSTQANQVIVAVDEMLQLLATVGLGA